MSQELINNLHAAYRSDFEAAKALVVRAQDEKRELTAEESAHYDKLSDAMNSKMSKIEDIKKGEDRAAKVATYAAQVETTSVKGIDNDAELIRAVLAGEKVALRESRRDQAFRHVRVEHDHTSWLRIGRIQSRRIRRIL